MRVTAIGRAFAALTLCSLACAPPGRASVLYVNAAATQTPRDGSSWSHGMPLLQGALDAAAANDEIWVAAGTYVQTVTLKPDVAVYGGFAGTETSRGQRDWRANPTILDGNKGGHVVTAPQGLTATAILDGFTVTNGKAAQGGGVYVYKCAAVFRNLVITDNVDTDGSYGGGGMMLDSTSAQVLACVIARNTAALDAGGIYAYGGTPRIANCVIALNHAGRWGGGIRLYGGGAVVANNTIVGNSADTNGGGWMARDGGSPTVAGNIVAFNSSGVRVDDASPRQRYNCVYGNAGYDYSNTPDVTGTSGNIRANPMVSPDPAGVWHIAPDSPCRNRGDSSVLAPGETDIDGQARVQGAAVDIGADESDGSTPVLWAIRVRADGDDANDGRTWDHPKKTIQAGIDATALTGGEVWVAAETYVELLTVKPSVQVYGGFAGDEATRAQRDWRANTTIVDGNKGGSTVTFAAGAARDCVLDGFTITGGQATIGGGIRCQNASPTITHNVITGNASTGTNDPQGGGGVYAQSAYPLIANNTIVNNTAALDGAGVFLYGGYMRLTSNTIAMNSAQRWGGGVALYGSAATLANNTITRNWAKTNGGGLMMRDGAWPTIVNNIIAWNYMGVYTPNDVTPRLRYNCVYGNSGYDFSRIADPTGRDGNIMRDPGLVADARANMHIAPASPCLNAGDNGAVLAGETDIDGQARVQGAAVDIGADESDGSTPAPVVIRVRSDGNDLKDGSSWANAKRRPQAGIDAVSATGGEVWVAAGVYYGNITMGPGVRLYGGFAGAETARDARSWRANETILDGNLGGSVISVSFGGAGDTGVDGFIITNGKAPSGGGIYCYASDAVFRNNTITANAATDPSYGGGGIFANGNSPTFINNTIRNNTATRDGAGVYLYGGNARLVSNTISHNSASRYGGGLYGYGSVATVANNTFTGNSGTQGGAVEAQDGASLDLVNNIIAYNTSGIRQDNSVPRLRYNDLFANTAYDYSNIADPTGEDGNVDWDPMLRTDAHGDPHIAPTSPCRDAGDNSVVIAGDTDIDTQARIQNAFVDLGADESDGTLPAPRVIRVKPTGSDANDGSTWALALRRPQAAIDLCAGTGGEVWVMKGTYTGLVTLASGVQVYGGFAGTEASRDARDFRKNVTILDGNKGGSVVRADGGQGPDTVLDGFTVRNGAGTQWDNQLVGGGVYINGSNPIIRNNTITANVATTNNYGGAGIWVVGGAAQILANTIHHNGPCAQGGGIYCWGTNARIADNTIANNTANGTGGGVYIRDGGAPEFSNNTIINNYAGSNGGALGVYNNSVPSFTNNILAFNSSGIRQDSADARFRYNDVFGNVAYDWSNITDYTGVDGNVEVDPLLSTDAHGDAHIAPNSPCRNAGDNAAVYPGDLDIDSQARIQDGVVDIGADESNGALPPVPTIRVKTDGNDLNDGSTWALAKRRLQPAIDAAAATGGEVWVARGSYAGTVSLAAGVQVYGGFTGAETARSARDPLANETILDGNQAGSSVTISGGQGRDCVLDGFTVTNGNGTLWDNRHVGGGVFCTNASPTIRNNVIRGNSATGNNYGGGGVFAYGGTPLFANNVIRENTSANSGAGVYLQSSNAVLTGNLIVKNTAASAGGGVMGWNGGSPLLANNTIADNTAASNAGAVIMWDGCTGTLVNNIVAFNSSGVRTNTDIRLRYNLVFGNVDSNFNGLADVTGVDANIKDDPQFVDHAGGNYRITGGSPCVDAGDDSVVAAGDADMDGQPRIHGAHVDMGAYEVSLGVTLADAILCLRYASGVASCSSADLTRLNLATAGASQLRIDVADAIAVTRLVKGH